MANKNRKQKSVKITKLGSTDIPSAINLHARLIPSAGALMGQPYLRELYAVLLNVPAHHLLIGAFEGKRLVGFLCATDNAAITDRLLRYRLFPVIPAILWGLIRGHYSIIDLICHRQVHHAVRRISAGSVYILNIAVDPEFQRQRIATRLMGELMRRWKAKTLFVDTLTTNQRAQKFYKKLGFVPVADVADSVILRYRSVVVT